MNAPVAPPVEVTIDKRVEQYVKLRDLIKTKEEAHKKELAPYKETLEQLNADMLRRLDEMGANSANTPNGTVYKTDKSSASISDMAAFWTHCVVTGDFDLIDKKANVTAVREYIQQKIEESKADPNIIPGAPPGVNFTQRFVVGVRRS